jgi:uncharacterized protein
LSAEGDAMVRFIRYELRTLDLDPAREFYTDLFGADLWGPDVRIARLPEQAIARGARPHWLGYLGVGDVEGTAERLVALGGQRLGPTMKSPSSSFAIVRDPFGAVLAVSSEVEPPRAEVVASHVLHTSDHEGAFGAYSTLFGWAPRDLLDLGADEGLHLGFAWDAHGSRAGSVSNAARSPRVHPHWLFFFRAPNVDEGLALVRARGGLALAPQRTPEGDRVAACDDPQGAAFGMFERRRPR